jgi:CheY-like chemotaxis protein
MNPKILLADDSLTIQKVVKITLSNEPYDLIECSEEANLLASVEKNQPDIVFLDFSLSSEKTGYELCREIKSVYARTKVVMMYGTFDTIEEEELKLVNASAHIVKPFDSTRFISLCHSLASLEDDEIDQVTSDASDDLSDDLIDDLPLDHQLHDEKTGDIDPDLIEQLNHDSSSSINSTPDEAWQMEVPPTMQTEQAVEDNFELPPIIETSDAVEVLEEAENKELNQPVDAVELPPVDDLEYPDIEALTQQLDELPLPPPKSKLISADELMPVEAIDKNDKDDEFDHERVKNLEQQLVDEIDEDDLWSADDGIEAIPPKLSATDSVESSSADLPPVKESMKALNDLDALFPEEEMPEFEVKLTNTPSDTQVSNEVPVESQIDDSPSLTHLDVDDLTEKILAKLLPVIEQKITDQVSVIVSQEYDKRFSPSVDQAVWKLVPDLASKIINQEIEEIRKKIL